MSATVNVRLKVNGVDHAPRLLVHALRVNLDLTRTHVGCDTSNCGACTFHLDGLSVTSCTVPRDQTFTRRSEDWATAGVCAIVKVSDGVVTDAAANAG